MTTDTGFPKTGVTYIAQLESEQMLETKLALCNTCFATASNQPLKRCTGCQISTYCSKECQKRAWPKHRTLCHLVQGKGKKNNYLSRMEQGLCFSIIIDSYRVRCVIDHQQRQEDHGIFYPGKWEHGLVWAKGDAYADFQNYLDLAENSGILPPWWDHETRLLCLTNAVDSDNPENIFKEVDQRQLIARYQGDIHIRTAMCILAELVVGYEGKGPSRDGDYYDKIKKSLDQLPEEREKLLGGAADSIKSLLEAHGKPSSNAQ